jgi:hypothetical protein
VVRPTGHHDHVQWAQRNQRRRDEVTNVGEPVEELPR